MTQIFITGTDTDAGKTLVSCALLHLFNQKGYTTHALKPVATGCDPYAPRPQDDLYQLQQAMNNNTPTSDMCAFYDTTPCAPNLSKKPPTNAKDLTQFCQAHSPEHTLTLIEGIGGWLCPINPHETMADVAGQLGSPVIMVVNIRLGCLNHSLLTHKVLQQSQLKVIGWVANQTQDNMPKAQNNIDYLTQTLPYPCLGHIPPLEHPCAQLAASYLDFETITAQCQNSLKHTQAKTQPDNTLKTKEAETAI